MTEQQEKTDTATSEKFYKIQFRENEQVFSASSPVLNLQQGDVGMIQTDHNLEPARILGWAAQPAPEDRDSFKTNYVLHRPGTKEEIDKYLRLIEREEEAVGFCRRQINKLQLSMKLIRVERFFNGSKIIFYFTAENRVDFRQLVKDLVQEFRTRVEMRQIGVRHETKMVGGLGCCGRELCCSSYINNFAPVSIKMAKEQSLPLNPVKISGICNRLLCCLTYEYPTYREIRKELPRQGKKLTVNGKKYKVIKQNVLEETVVAVDLENPDTRRVLGRAEWGQVDQHTDATLTANTAQQRKKTKKQDKKEKTSKGTKK